MQRFVWVACAATAAVLLAPPARAGSLRAGYAYGDITPDQAKYGNVWMGGYSFFRLSDGVHD
ncbi:MAG: hypothetical protein FJ125_09905, partial [Deltaproteobacteria bacterium]|nr:hypothetical protein [Deltaproteobacteria bacterium]